MLDANFSVQRDCDDLFCIRKVVVELWVCGGMVDRRRMFAGPFFFRRLVKKMKRMIRFADMIQAASKEVIE